MTERNRVSRKQAGRSRPGGNQAVKAMASRAEQKGYMERFQCEVHRTPTNSELPKRSEIQRVSGGIGERGGSESKE
jgi:hypothetical protein